MKRFIPWFAGLVVLGACDKASDPVAPRVDPPSFGVVRFFHENFKGQFDAFANNCNGDVVPMLITFSGNAIGQINNGNRAHFEQHVTFRGQGVGEPSGLEYNLNEVDNFVDNFDASDFAGETFTSVVNGHVNAQGSAPDLKIHFLFHITINANGELTAFVDNFVFECK
jgi:hypothetical protein